MQLPPEWLDAIADEIAARVIDRLSGRIARSGRDGWLTTREAAAYLGMTVNALHKLTSARMIPFSQEGKGSKCWFRRADLDNWRDRNGRGPAT